MKTWTVLRHSGRSTYPPRIAFTGPEPRAREFFRARRRELKQGSILLMDHVGGIQAYFWSPKGS